MVPGAIRLAEARENMTRLGLWSPRQYMGRRWPVGCVALEITQRCNLDCTACYLSEASQALHDIPLEEIFRRIDGIRARYGEGTDVQVTGGEPTLRSRDDLLAIVRRASDAGLRPALFTNGIRAGRALLGDLARAGLRGVAFHVDTTQMRKGYASEAELNDLRRAYVARARGLPLAVYFNTTVHAGNLREVAPLARFFVEHSDTVRLASFQLHAETGRGVLGARAAPVSVAAVAAALRDGAQAPLDFDAVDIGHPGCNRYAMALVANGRVHDLLDDRALVAAVLEATARVHFEHRAPMRALASGTRALLRRPATLVRGAAWLVRKAWKMRRELVAARGRVRKLSFFIHDFMHACELDPERIAACSFMVQTGTGPVSMCAHNAQRDAYLLQPTRLGDSYWDPVRGRTGPAPLVQTVQLTRRNARGRARLAL